MSADEYEPLPDDLFFGYLDEYEPLPDNILDYVDLRDPELDMMNLEYDDLCAVLDAYGSRRRRRDRRIAAACETLKHAVSTPLCLQRWA